jgi:hypothetical protein
MQRIEPYRWNGAFQLMNSMDHLLLYLAKVPQWKHTKDNPEIHPTYAESTLLSQPLLSPHDRCGHM